MADLGYVRQGQPFKLPAATFNALIDVARVNEANKLNQNARPSFASSAGMILVKNNTGANLDAFTVAGLDVPVVLPSAALDEFKAHIVLNVVSPTSSHLGRFAVLQEPIANGAIGRAVVSGETVVQLNVTAEADEFADVAAGVTATLKTGSTGARILWKESGTGTKWAVVLLGAGAAGTGSQLAIITDDSLAIGWYSFKLVARTGTAFASGTDLNLSDYYVATGSTLTGYNRAESGKAYHRLSVDDFVEVTLDEGSGDTAIYRMTELETGCEA